MTADPLDDLPPAEDAEPPAVGMAKMDQDGTLRLFLHTRTADGLIGEMVRVVGPDDERYAGYVAHLGGIQPGQAKPIPPFPPPEIDPKSI